MRKKGYKGRCEKKDLSKSQEVCRTYDAIQSTYADILQNDNGIQEIRCNVLLDGLSEGAYTSDFVCVKSDGDLMVRECVFRKFLTKPMTVKLPQEGHVGSVDVDIMINHLTLQDEGYQNMSRILQKNGYKEHPEKYFSFVKTVMVDGISYDVDVDILAGMYGGTQSKRRSQHVQGVKALKATGGNPNRMLPQLGKIN